MILCIEGVIYISKKAKIYYGVMTVPLTNKPLEHVFNTFECVKKKYLKSLL